VTALSWLLILALGAEDKAAVLMGFIPARLSGVIDVSPAVWPALTPLTATLVHGGALHLAFNLLMLVWCGLAVERILGGGALVTLYVVGAFVASTAHWIVDPGSLGPGIGASGAISAVIGAFAMMFSQQRRVTSSARLNRWINAAWLLASWIVLQLLMGWMLRQQGVLQGTAAHIGGFVAGLAMQRALLLWRYRGA
jgi:membrane associated rhomboid family serine protease